MPIVRSDWPAASQTRPYGIRRRGGDCVKPTRNGALAYLIAITVIVLDQLTKHWVLETLHLPFRGTVDVLGPLRLTFVQNEGVSFGLFRGEEAWIRWALAAFSLVV